MTYQNVNNAMGLWKIYSHTFQNHNFVRLWAREYRTLCTASSPSVPSRGCYGNRNRAPYLLPWLRKLEWWRLFGVKKCFPFWEYYVTPAGMFSLKGSLLGFFIVKGTCLVCYKFIHDSPLDFQQCSAGCLRPLQFRAQCYVTLISYSVAHYRLVIGSSESSSISLFHLNTAEYLLASQGLPLLKAPPHMCHCLICLFFLWHWFWLTVNESPFINSCCRLFQERGVGAPVTQIPLHFFTSRIQFPFGGRSEVRFGFI